jgi:hypothetical protein
MDVSWMPFFLQIMQKPEHAKKCSQLIPKMSLIPGLKVGLRILGMPGSTSAPDGIFFEFLYRLPIFIKRSNSPFTGVQIQNIVLWG